MTKEAYMAALREALLQYDRAFSEEILQSCEEHFETGLRDGKTEEEICAELGSAEEIAREAQELMGDRDIQTKAVVPFSAIEKAETIGDVKKVVLAVSGIDVRISPAPDGRLHARLEGNPEYARYLQESFANNTYTVTEIAQKGILSWFLRSTSSGVLVLELPEHLEELSVQTQSGDVELRGISPAAGKLESSSGDWEISDLCGGKLKLRSKSGDIKLQNMDGDWEIATVSGDLSAENMQGQTMKLSTISGDMDLQQIHARTLQCTTTSGDIDFQDGEFGTVYLKTVSGDVEGAFFAEEISGRTVSGDLHLRLARRGRKLETKTTTVSGSVRVPSKAADEGAEGTIAANFQTVSGDIILK